MNSLLIKPQSTLLKVLIFFIIFLSLLPSAFVQEIIKIDHFFSSHHMFELAFLHGSVFGIDIIDNVGPYGFLHYPYTYTGGAFWAKIAWFSMFCVIYAYYATLLANGIKTIFEKGLFIFAIMFFPLQIDFPWYSYEVLPRLAVLFSALYLLTESNHKPIWHQHWHIVLNGVFYALLVLEKASNVHYLLLLTTIVCLFWTKQRRYKDAIYLVSSFLSGIIILWLLAGQKLSNLPVYFNSMNAFINSYQNVLSSSMNQTYLVYASSYCIILAFLLLFRTGVSMWFTRTWNELLQSILISALVFLSWKHGMIRSTNSYGTILYILPCVFAFVCFYPIYGLDKVGQKIIKKYSFITCGIYLLFLSIFWGNMNAYEHEINLKRTVAKEFHHRLSMLVSYKPQKKLKELNKQLEMLKNTSTLSPSLKSIIGQRTIDEFGDTPELIFLNKLNYAPRPVPINQIVANPILNEKNGRFYQNKTSAPDFVLLKDFNLKLTDTSAYLSLLFNYHTRDQMQPWLLLEKNPTWNTIRLENKVKMQQPINQWIDLSNFNSYFTWLQIDLKPSVLGELKNILYKFEKVRLELMLDNGNINQYDISLSQLASGFLINPIIKSKNVNSCNIDHFLPWNRVKAFKIAIDPAEKLYLFQNHYDIHLAKIAIYNTSHKTLLNLEKAKNHIAYFRNTICHPVARISSDVYIGQWLANGKPARILLNSSGDGLIIENELGTPSEGILSKDHQQLIATEWNNIYAKLSKNKRQLIWSNGSSWTR